MIPYKKECFICKERLSQDNFYILKTGKLFSYCKECTATKAKKDWVKYGEKIKNKRVEKAKTPESKLELKIRNLKRRYGLEYNDWLDLLKKQYNKCEICNREFTEELSPVVDHCHKTENVRGLLCNSCNRGIGYLQDNYDIINSAANYLYKYKEDTCEQHNR